VQSKKEYPVWELRIGDQCSPLVEDAEMPVELMKKLNMGTIKFPKLKADLSCPKARTRF
jgi:hypothetical protein